LLPEIWRIVIKFRGVLRFNDDGNGKFERPPLPTADVERLRDRSELLKNIEKSSRFSINTQHLTPNEIQYAESRSSGINLFLSGGELMSSLNIPKDMEEDFGKNPLGRATVCHRSSQYGEWLGSS